MVAVAASLRSRSELQERGLALSLQHQGTWSRSSSSSSRRRVLFRKVPANPVLQECQTSRPLDPRLHDCRGLRGGLSLPKLLLCLLLLLLVLDVGFLVVCFRWRIL